MKQELRHTSPFLKAVVGRGLLTSSRAPTVQSRRGHQLWRVKRERAPIAVNRLDCAALMVLWSVDLRSHRLELSFVCGYFHASFHIATEWSRNCDTLFCACTLMIVSHKSVSSTFVCLCFIFSPTGVPRGDGRYIPPIIWLYPPQ